MKKKVLSTLLVICMLLSLLPMTALATGESVGGITSADDLRAALTKGGSYTLSNDIALGDWASVTVPSDFTLDGNGHTLSGMNVTEAVGTGNSGTSGSDYSLYHAGLIGYATANVTLTNLKVSGATVAPSKVTGAPNNYVYKNGLSSAAVLIGTSSGGKTIVLNNVSVTNSTVTGVTKLGAFVGQNNSALNITNCEISGCTVTGEYNYAPVAGYSATKALINASGLTLSGNSMVFQKVDEDFQAYISADGIANSVTPAYAVETVNKRLWATSSDYYVVNDGSTPSTVTGYNVDYTMKRVAVTVADSFVCSIGNTYYATLADAITNATAGDTIVLGADVTIADADRPVITKNLTLDLNGKTLTYSSTTMNKAAMKVENGAALTIKDSGVNGIFESQTGYGIYVGKDAKLTVDGGTIKSAYYQKSDGKFDSAAISGNGTHNAQGVCTNGNTTIIINGGKIIGGAAGIYHPQSGTLTVNGGTIQGNTGIEVKSGDANVTISNTATIKGIGTKTHNPNSDGQSTSGYAVALVENAGYAGNATVNLNGGTYTGPVAKLQDSANTTYTYAMSISGGYFTSDPSDYLAAEKIAQATKNDGYNYEVVDKTNDAVIVAPAPAAVTVPTSADTTVSAAAAALQATVPTATGLVGAAGVEAQKVTTTATEAAEKLASVDSTATAGNTKIYTQPYLDIELTGATAGEATDPGTLTVSITPMIKAVASTAATADDIAQGNSAQIGEAQKLTVTTPVTIKLPIPAAMAVLKSGSTTEYQPLTIKHVKENGAVYYYFATVTKDGNNYYATFTVTHGFSEFTLMAADYRHTQVDFDRVTPPGLGVYYDVLNVGDALPTDAKPGSYRFNGWFFDGVDGGPYTTLTDELLTALSALSAKQILDLGYLIKATPDFTYIGGSAVSTYTLTFETNGGAKLDSVSKNAGDTVDLGAYKPTREGYAFAGWYSDKTLTTPITSVKLTTNTTVYAKWAKAMPFTDVKDDAYYKAAVDWAVEQGITDGTSATTFSPNAICTRAQAVTFLWRAYGEPAPTSTVCPFTDVKTDAYYYNAVLWAVEKGITVGTSATTFSPDANCTRSQIVTLQYRAAGSPATGTVNPFTDVAGDAYYTPAVLWAVKEGITAGTTPATFSPDAECTRAQIVTFLYRQLGE